MRNNVFFRIIRLLGTGVTCLIIILSLSCVSNPITQDKFNPERSGAGAILPWVLGPVPIVGQLIHGEWIEAGVYAALSIGGMAAAQIETLSEDVSGAVFMSGGLVLAWAFFDGLATTIIRELQHVGFNSYLISSNNYIDQEMTETGSIYPSIFPYYESNAVLSVTLTNRNIWAMEDIKLSSFSDEIMDFPHEAAALSVIEPDTSVTLPMTLVLSPKVLDRMQAGSVPLQISMSYRVLDDERLYEMTIPLEIEESNYTPNIEAVAAFVTPLDVPVREIGRAATQAARPSRLSGLNQNLQMAMEMWAALRVCGVKNKTNTKWYNGEGVLVVAKPRDALLSASAAPADLAVLYASLLESVGIQSAIVTDGNNIAVALNTGVELQNASTISVFPGRVTPYKDNGWVAVSVLDSSLSFVNAWSNASNLTENIGGIGDAQWIDLRENWPIYPSMPLPEITDKLLIPPEDEFAAAFLQELNAYIEEELASAISRYETKVQSRPHPRSYNALAVAYARFGQYDQAIAALDSANQLDDQYAPAWVNRANIYLINNNYQAAVEALSKAHDLKPVNTSIIIRLIKSLYQLGNNQEASELYRKLAGIDAVLAGEHRYLLSNANNEQGTRASSAIDTEIDWFIDEEPIP